MMTEDLQEFAKRIYEERQNINKKLEAAEQEAFRNKILSLDKKILDMFDISNKNVLENSLWPYLVISIRISYSYFSGFSENTRVSLTTEPYTEFETQLPTEIQTIKKELEEDISKEGPTVIIQQIGEDFSKNPFFEVNYDETSENNLSLTITIKDDSVDETIE